MHENVSSVSLVVSVIAADENPAVYFFEANVKGSSPPIGCRVANVQSNLKCELAGLSPATLYTVTVKACLPGSSGCSRSIEDSVWTMPTGMLKLFLFQSFLF